MKESEIQSDILDLLLVHPKIAWCMAITTGFFKVRGGSITTGHYMTEDQERLTGMSDILGQMRDGRLFACEVKVPGKEPTKEQYEFLDLVNRNGGFAIWADSVEKVAERLKEDEGNE